MADDVISRLAQIIHERRTAAPETSYTRQLIDGGPAKPAKKLGEEATETVIAAICEDDQRLKSEAADLIYHLLVVLECRAVPVADVLAELERRLSMSGIAEKAARKPPNPPV
ncbi:MAG: phosphoribosyl-ATP diphosphatase [Hyphomicrobiaceae bacterium]